MLKKFFKAVTTLILLVGCYFGYVHVFAIVVEQFRATRHPKPSFSRSTTRSRSWKRSRYAKAAFGPDHWSAAEDLAYRYYNAERGFWIYAKEWERIVEEERRAL